MTVKGCDFAGGRPGADALRTAGIGFVARYLADSLGNDGRFKNLTADEARSYLDAGISIMPVWEGAAREALSNFSVGQAHGQDWKSQADRLGIPQEVRAWWTVDTDAGPGDLDSIAAYAQGFAQAVAPHPTGVYGDGAVCQAMHDRRLVSGTWATNATSWPGGAFPFADVVQVPAAQGGATTIGGVKVDLDTAFNLDGMWGAPQTTIQGGHVFNPPLQLTICADLDCPAGGAWQLQPDGAIITCGSAPYRGGANGKPYFANRTAHHLEPPTTAQEQQDAATIGGSCYVIVATNNQRYGPVF
jgi:hypothetical protein